MNFKKAREIIKLKRKLVHVRGLGFVKLRFMNKDLWRFNYSSTARACMIGMFWMMIPMPFQMLPAVVLCVYLRANIPLALICVWISNPLTWLPIYFANYLLGSYLLGMDTGVADWHSYALYVAQHIGKFWQPLYLGSIVGGILLGGLCYCGIYLSKYIFVLFKKK